jgi:HAD superfamily hydrolase (TIGR01459 family)
MPRHQPHRIGALHATAFVDGVGAFIDAYEGFLIDQWGVLHNGERVYPGAFEVLAEMSRRNKRVVLLTNSGRRRSFNEERLSELGFNTRAMAGIVTSGEATWHALRQRDAEPFKGLGRRCLLFTRADDMGPVEGLDLELVHDPAEADFLYLTWLDALTHSIDAFDRVIEVAAARGLPMVCSNPDRVAPTEGGLTQAPGSLAERYRGIGGQVIYVGKPHAPIYRACLDVLGDLEPTEICAIGDSFEHDVQGAKNAGLAAAFVTRGIHAEAFPEGASRAAGRRALDALAAEHGVTADWALPHFRL